MLLTTASGCHVFQLSRNPYQLIHFALFTMLPYFGQMFALIPFYGFTCKYVENQPINNLLTLKLQPYVLIS